MATRNIVPRATGEGQIGTSAKTWDAGYFDDLSVTNGVTASTFTGDLTGDVTGNVTGNVTGDVTGNVTGDVTGDVTGTASGNLPLTGGTLTGGITYSGVNVVAAQSADTDEYVEIVGGTNESTGAHISVYGKDHASKAGNITMEAYDGTNTNRMVLEPTGSAQIGSKEVERVHATGTNYIRYVSGLQICWGNVTTNSNGTGKAISFGAAFSANPTIVATPGSLSTNPNAYGIQIKNLTTTGCDAYMANGSTWVSGTLRWIAIGFWA